MANPLTLLEYIAMAARACNVVRESGSSTRSEKMAIATTKSFHASPLPGSKLPPWAY